jgi:hypothetical protein
LGKKQESSHLEKGKDLCREKNSEGEIPRTLEPEKWFAGLGRTKTLRG